MGKSWRLIAGYLHRPIRLTSHMKQGGEITVLARYDFASPGVVQTIAHERSE